MICQRSKFYIEELEQRIRELTQAQDARDFEQVERRNKELEEELRQLRGFLGWSDGSAQPIYLVDMSLNVTSQGSPPSPKSDFSAFSQDKPQMDSMIPLSRNDPARSVGSASACPVWRLSLRFLPPAGPVDSILLGLSQRQRSLATENTPGLVLIGPYHPDLRALVNADIPNNAHPVSLIVCSLFRRIEYYGFAEKAATLFLVYHFIQWQILPTMETYNNMPDWFRPRRSQLVTHHPFWTSLVREPRH